MDVRGGGDIGQEWQFLVFRPGLHKVDAHVRNLTALSLEPALRAPSTTPHIFAFESGATWGAGNSGGSNDWDMPTGAAFGSGEVTGAALPASFLSLSTGNTWGGFGGTSLNGDNTKSPGD